MKLQGNCSYYYTKPRVTDCEMQLNWRFSPSETDTDAISRYLLKIMGKEGGYVGLGCRFAISAGKRKETFLTGNFGY
jgi:hypothetical protein